MREDQQHGVSSVLQGHEVTSALPCVKQDLNNDFSFPSATPFSQISGSVSLSCIVFTW